jgi:hypothetical protein
VNQNGGINGRPLGLVENDDKSDVPTLIANLSKFIQQDKVFATVGPFISTAGAARQVAEQNKVPMVGIARLHRPAQGHQYQWGHGPCSHRRRPARVDKVIKASGWKNILGLADVLNIDQETSICGPGRMAGL